MMRLPREPNAGERPKASDMRLLLRYLRSITPLSTPTVKARITSNGCFLDAAPASTPGRAVTAAGWPFKVYDATTAEAGGQVQINGGDGFVAQLNGFIANVNGQANDTSSGSPAVYPKLAVTGNGVIYGYMVATGPGVPYPTTLDIYYGGTLPGFDTATPATYLPFMLASITDYTVGESGKPSFKVNNVTNYGFTTLIYCQSGFQIY